jgi:hypothetical protein
LGLSTVQFRLVFQFTGMKKYSLVQIVIIGIIMLAAGFLAGIAVNNLIPGSENLAGTISKTESFRNIKITDDDLLLRNELVVDSSKSGQYQRFLLHHYIQAEKIASVVGRALEKTSEVEAFKKSQSTYALSFRSLGVAIEPARADIMRVLNLLASLKSNGNFPIIDYLNEAQNAILRIRVYENTAANFGADIASFISTHSDTTNVPMKEAYQILTNYFDQAEKTIKNRPYLNYRGQKILLSDF